MERYAAFRPGGPTFQVTASTPASIGTQASGSNSGEVTFLIYNSGSIDAALGFAATGSTAMQNAVWPTSSIVSNALVIKGGSVQTFTLPPFSFFSGATNPATGGATNIFITPGDGV